MNQDQLNKLAQKFLEGTATDTEKKQLHEWYDQVVTSREIPEDPEMLRLRMREQVLRRTAGKARWYRRMAAAAAVLLLISAGAYITWNGRQAALSDTASQYRQDVAPGSNKATLTLGDGRVIELDDAANGALGSQGSTKVIKMAGAQLAYDDGNAAGLKVLYNTVNTPRGGQYQVILADGSRVWLNAESSIRFPTAFPGKERKVELKGEAYFDIAENAAKPFIVSVNEMEVEVLGTEFNIMAYTSESTVKTSLLQGAVRVKQGAASRLLRPGQQAQLYKDGSLKVISHPYIEDAAAWKDGMFVFNNEDLESILRRVCRWYNVEVEFRAEGLKSQVFTGQVARHEKLSEVLKMLELTEAVNFEIDNRKIIVKQ